MNAIPDTKLRRVETMFGEAKKFKVRANAQRKIAAVEQTLAEHNILHWVQEFPEEGYLPVVVLTDSRAWLTRFFIENGFGVTSA